MFSYLDMYVFYSWCCCLSPEHPAYLSNVHTLLGHSFKSFYWSQRCWVLHQRTGQE